MRRMKKGIAVVLAAAMVCGSVSTSTTAEAASKKYVKKVTVSKSSVSMNVGDKTNLTAKVTVKGSVSKKVTVKSSDKKIVSVSVKAGKSGKSTIKLTAKKEGTATITVKTKGKNKKNKVLSKKIKVTVVGKNKPNNTTTQQPTTQQPTTEKPTTETPSTDKTVSAISIQIEEKSVDLKIGLTCKLTAKVFPENCTDTIKWSSSDTSVATVDQSGTVKATTKEGTAVITATAGSKKASCNVRVYKPFSQDDYNVEQLEDKIIHIDFNAPDEETANLYKGKPGYVVDGKNVKADVPCESYKYTFTKLPTTLEDIQQIKLDNRCAPMAAMICAIHSVDTDMPSATFASVNGNTLLPMLNYIGGPACNLLDPKKTSPLLHAQFLADRMFEGRGGAPYLRNCYFDGATPNNGYTPTTPYTITMYVGPYYISEHQMLDGTMRPQTFMVLTEFAGDDSPRYIDVYKSSRDNCWYALNSSPYETFKQLMAKPKAIIDTPEW